VTLDNWSDVAREVMVINRGAFWGSLSLSCSAVFSFLFISLWQSFVNKLRMSRGDNTISEEFMQQQEENARLQQERHEQLQELLFHLPRVQANLNASLRELKDEVKNLDRDGKKS
jgi:hypothetical protein